MKEGWDVRSGGVWAPVLPSLGGGKTREGLGLGLGVEERVRVKKTSGEKQKECLDFSSQHLATKEGKQLEPACPAGLVRLLSQGFPLAQLPPISLGGLQGLQTFSLAVGRLFGTLRPSRIHGSLCISRGKRGAGHWHLPVSARTLFS